MTEYSLYVANNTFEKWHLAVFVGLKICDKEARGVLPSCLPGQYQVAMIRK